MTIEDLPYVTVTMTLSEWETILSMADTGLGDIDAEYQESYFATLDKLAKAVEFEVNG